jgi:hypothetical protein
MRGDNMAADLHIHIFEGITEDDLRVMNSHTIGSKYFNFNACLPWEEERKISDKVGNTPNIWIGEVSWLKAALYEDGADTFIPNTVGDIADLVGEDLPIIDDEFIAKVVAAFKQPNNTAKEVGPWSGKGYSLAKAEEVKAFLELHKGKKVFQISW